MNKPVVIYGNGALAGLILYVNAQEKLIEVAAITAEQEYLTSKTVLDYPTVSFDRVDSVYPPDQVDMLVAIGYRRMRDRVGLFNRAKDKGYSLINFISKNALIYNPVVMGSNNIIFGGVYIGPEGSIEDHNIIRPNAYVGHGIRLGNHNYIAPGVNIGGGCRIGDLCYIGIGATVIDQRILADDTLIGAGALMLHHSESSSKYLGVPARKISSHEATGICI